MLTSRNVSQTVVAPSVYKVKADDSKTNLVALQYKLIYSQRVHSLAALYDTHSILVPCLYWRNDAFATELWLHFCSARAQMVYLYRRDWYVPLYNHEFVSRRGHLGSKINAVRVM